MIWWLVRKDPTIGSCILISVRQSVIQSRPTRPPVRRTSRVRKTPNPLCAPMLGTIVQFEAGEGDLVHEGQSVAILEAMKMQHLIKTPLSGEIRWICAHPGDTLAESQPLMFIEPRDVNSRHGEREAEVNLDVIRPDLAEVLERHKAIMDESRPKAVERRRKAGQRTARENIGHLLDPGSLWNMELWPWQLSAPGFRWTS